MSPPVHQHPLTLDNTDVLRITPVKLDTLRENVIVLARNCKALRPERLRGFRKVEIRTGTSSIVANILISEDPNMVSSHEIGITQPALRRLGAAAGDLIHISLAQSPHSLDAVRAKIRGEPIDEQSMHAIVSDLANHRYSDMEVSAFLIACADFLTTDELLYLTKAMVDVGSRLTWPNSMVVDKHCIGGVPNNRTTLIVTPIIAAHGLTMPKTSSRAITSPAGSADTMEIFARVDLSEDEMRAVVEKCGACIVWGGHVNLSPADDVLISVERPLSLDTAEQMVASILSKKLSAGSTHLLIDMPIGPTAKVRSHTEANRIRKLFEFVGEQFGLVVDTMFSDGTQPVGRGVGPALEARDVRAVLENQPNAPQDLKEKALAVAGRILEFDPAVRGGKGLDRARELLESGVALTKMEAIIEAQGASPCSGALGTLTLDIVAPADGRIQAIDCFKISRIARLAGAPTDSGAGLDLFKRIGDFVQAGEPLYRLYAEDPADFAFASAVAGEGSGYALERS